MPMKKLPVLQSRDLESIGLEMGGIKGYNVARGVPYEMLTLSVALTVVVMKILFDVFTVILLVLCVEPDHGHVLHLQPIFGSLEDDQHQVWTVLVFILITSLTSIHTIMLVNSRMNASFLDTPALLRNYNWSNVWGSMSQFIVYFVYIYCVPIGFIGTFYGNAMGVIVALDMITCIFMFVLEWRVCYMRKRLADEAVGAILISSGKHSGDVNFMRVGNV